VIADLLLLLEHPSTPFQHFPSQHHIHPVGFPGTWLQSHCSYSTATSAATVAVVVVLDVLDVLVVLVFLLLHMLLVCANSLLGLERDALQQSRAPPVPVRQCYSGHEACMLDTCRVSLVLGCR